MASIRWTIVVKERFVCARTRLGRACGRHYPLPLGTVRSGLSAQSWLIIYGALYRGGWLHRSDFLERAVRYSRLRLDRLCDWRRRFCFGTTSGPRLAARARLEAGTMAQVGADPCLGTTLMGRVTILHGSAVQEPIRLITRCEPETQRGHTIVCDTASQADFRRPSSADLPILREDPAAEHPCCQHLLVALIAAHNPAGDAAVGAIGRFPTTNGRSPM